MGGLLCITVGKEGSVDPSKELDVKLAELADEYSGKFGVEVFGGGPLDKEELKLGYCIGCCCNEGGIPNPCGGRGNDC